MQTERNSLFTQLRGTRDCGQHTRDICTFPKSRDQLATLCLGSLDGGLNFVRSHVRIAVSPSSSQSLKPTIKLLQFTGSFSGFGCLFFQQACQMTLHLSNHGRDTRWLA
ncbi:MAG: hypothetical protein ABW110_03090 [Steroidobacteraceae bacterium]